MRYNDIEFINDLIQKNEIAEFIRYYEAKKDDEIKTLADVFARDIEKNRVVFVSGSSSVGKTTTTLKLEKYLDDMGINASTISLDDFFKSKEELPQKENGSVDYESVNALDLETLAEFFKKLESDKAAPKPVFSFSLGTRRDEWQEINIQGDSILMVEGLHALNDIIISMFPQDKQTTLYLEIGDAMYKDRRIFIEPTSIRFLRRLVRDYRYRKSSVNNTMLMWPGVLRGDREYVIPASYKAKNVISTFYPYDVSALKPDAYALLSEAKDDSPFEYDIADMLRRLSYVEPIGTKDIPPTALIREFIGESIYY